MITETISKIAVQILDSTGYAGAAGLMALESMIAPVPSEAVMPFVGFQVVDGKWNLAAAIIATSAGSLIGSLLSYLMGYYGGRPVVLSVGKYLLLNRRDLERTEAFFHKRAGLLTVFISRFIPVVRHFISIPAGMGRAPRTCARSRSTRASRPRSSTSGSTRSAAPPPFRPRRRESLR